MQYTKATLKTSLQQWNEENEATFLGALDEIIKRGEARLSRMLDLETLDGVSTTVTATSTELIAKPANLIAERMLSLRDGASRLGLYKRTRGWIDAMNSGATEARSEYYAEYNETNWSLCPIPNGVYTVYVHGLFTPTSITAGGDAATTWFSTNVGDLLQLACSIEACEFLKFWSHKAAAEAELGDKVKAFTGIAARLQRADIEDLIAGRQTANKPSTQQEQG